MFSNEADSEESPTLNRGTIITSASSPSTPPPQTAPPKAPADPPS
eukprot:GSA25T00020549001.1